jgi:hypothetical protein
MDLKQQLVDLIDHITEAKTEKVVLAIITPINNWLLRGKRLYEKSRL